MKLKYNKPIEVTKKQKEHLTIKFAGVVAHRTDENGKHWIKCLWTKYIKQVELFLNLNK